MAKLNEKKSKAKKAEDAEEPKSSQPNVEKS